MLTVIADAAAAIAPEVAGIAALVGVTAAAIITTDPTAKARRIARRARQRAAAADARARRNLAR